jgi:hypothetical protein
VPASREPGGGNAKWQREGLGAHAIFRAHHRHGEDRLRRLQVLRRAEVGAVATDRALRLRHPEVPGKRVAHAERSGDRGARLRGAEHPDARERGVRRLRSDLAVGMIVREALLREGEQLSELAVHVG